MNCRVMAVEQACLGEQENPRARRAQQRTPRMHVARPIHQLRIPANLPTLGTEKNRGNDDDVRRVDIRGGTAGFYRHATGERYASAVSGNDLDFKRRVRG